MIFIFIGLIILLLIIMFFSDNFITVIVSIIGIILGIIGMTYYSLIPKAIDVYKNKTELKINGYYNDSCFVPTDSIVIFKN